MSSRYDMVVIGAGNAGMAAAGIARERGLSVLVIEARDFGGTCPLRGCVPKKVLVAAAETLDVIARAGAHRIRVGEPVLQWSALIERKQEFVRGVPAEFEHSLERRGIDRAHGRARFTGEHAVTVDGREIAFGKAIVAAGSVPRPLPIEGREHLLTSDDVLELSTLPSSVAFLGAGVVAMEFAHVLSRAGARVTLLEMADAPLGNFDSDAVAALLREHERLDIRLHTGAEVQAVVKSSAGFTVRYRKDGADCALEAAAVVHGAGRIADYEPLDLPAAGIDVDDRGRPRLDEHLRSVSNRDVLFAGDAVPTSPQLSPVATYEGNIAAKNATGDELIEPDYHPIPQIVFTVPALAAVGWTEQQARQRGLDVERHVNEPAEWRSGRTYGETTAYAKVLVERGTGLIAGAHLVGHGAQETIHAFALLMRHRLPAAELKEMVAGYPTFHADLKYFV